MILQQYIQEVLFRQRVCIVPQIGTFSVQHFPAQYNVAAQTLTPPRDQVIFSQSWQDDGSCLEWIALKENLVPAVAQRKLEKYLEEFKAVLQSGTLELPGIGKLQGDFTGNIHFYPEELPVDAESLNITPIQRQEPPAAAPAPPPAPVPPAPQPVDNTPVEPVEPVMTEEEEDTLEAVREGGVFKWWQAVAAAVFLIGGLGVWWYVSHQSGSGTPEPASTAAVADTAAKAPADTVAAAPAVPDSISYHVVLEEFKDSLRAAHQAAKRKAWGQDVVMYKRDNIYKVAAPVKSLPIDTTSKLQEKRSEFKINKAYLEY